MMAALDQGVVGVSWYPATLPASKDADESKQMVLLVLLVLLESGGKYVL